MLCNEHISTVIKGDLIILPTDIAPSLGLPGIDKGTVVSVEESFASEDGRSWVLHVIPFEGGITRSVSFNLDSLVLVDG